MKRKKGICLFLFMGFILALSGCHPRYVSDIKLNMTKDQVASQWGKTPVVSSRTTDSGTTETWEYHFLNSNSICWVTFSQDRVVATQCRPLQGGGYWHYAQPGQNKPGPPSVSQGVVREGVLAVKLVETLKIGESKSEAEAENSLASVGIAPRNGWIADYPVTPGIIVELQNTIGEAADSGKLTMKKDEAIKAFQDLMMDIDGQYAGVEPSPGGQPYPGPYYYPYYPYYPAYPYSYGGYYRFYYPYRRYWR